MNWETLITLARRLATASDEASHRAAISRAYYGAHHLARLYLQQGTPAVAVPASGQAHSVVYNSFLSRGRNDQEKQIGIRLQRLYNSRRRADYDETVAQLGSELTKSITYAGEVQTSLAALRPPTTPAATPSSGGTPGGGSTPTGGSA